MTFEKQVAGLLQRAGLKGEPVIEPLAGGKNNRVFRLGLDGKFFLLKSYFWHPDDPRERLKTEFLFSTFLWERGVRNIPRPIASNPIHHLGLYAFVEGRKLAEEEVTESAVRQALDFFLAMNAFRKEEGANLLPLASEACFSLAEHITHVQKRIERLKIFQRTEENAHQAGKFIFERLVPQWEEVKKKISDSAADLLIQKERSLSPSDFGFHNAILTPEGKIIFHDFEYAGWDDPARMACDFFCQPEIPVSPSFLENFAEKVFCFLKNPKGPEKTTLLLPVYRIKWCCILLNEFLKEGSDRRKFSTTNSDADTKKEKQVALAKTYFEKHF